MSGVVQMPSSPNGVRPQRELSEREFTLFRNLVHERTGIALGPAKRLLLQSRLGTRLRALGLRSFTEYYRLLMREGDAGEEMARLVNAVTTNRTEFFREAHHFAYLTETWAPARVTGDVGATRLRVWSAGCSSGEEAYSIAITLLDAFSREVDLKILASDIDTDMIERGETGIYAMPDVAALPRATLTRYFLRGTGKHEGEVRVRPELRARVVFRRINLLDAEWPIRTQFDVIFCRNVLIYFDRPTQQRVLEGLESYLAPGALLVLGHAESLHGLLDGFTHLGSTIYRREKETA